MWAWERRFLPEADIGTGILPERFALPLTFAGWAALGLGLFALPALAPATLVAVLLCALVLWRLLILDLTYLVLPDVYTLPFLLVGLAAIPFLNLHPTWWWSLSGAALLFAIHYGLALLCAKFTGGTGGLGGGDIKLAAALGAWFGPVGGLVILALASALNMLPALLAPKRDIPFGFGLTLGSLIILALALSDISRYGALTF